MAWPMIEAVLDSEYSSLFNAERLGERSMLVFDTAESLVAPIMEDIEARFSGIRAFSLPSLGDGQDDRTRRRHIELGVKGDPSQVDAAFAAMRQAVEALGAAFDVT